MANCEISKITKFLVLLQITLSHSLSTIAPEKEVLRIKQDVELQTGTQCSFVSWSPNNVFYTIFDHISILKFQTFVTVDDLIVNTTKLTPTARWKFLRHCSLVFYYDPNLLILGSVAPKVWKSFIPGNPLFSYHVVYIPKINTLKALPLHFTTSTHLLILSNYQKKEYTDNAHHDLNPSGQLRAWSGPGYFHDRSNFYGEPLIWSTFAVNQGPLAPGKVAAYMKKEPRGFPNLLLDTVASVSKYCNASPVVLAEGHSTGKRNRWTKKWNGVIGLVTNGRAHVMLYSSLTKSYASVMIPTVAVLDGNSIVFFTGLPKSVAPPNPLSFFVKALDPVVAAFELSSMIVIALVIFVYLLVRNTDRNTSLGLGDYKEFNSIVFNMLRSFVEQNFSLNFRNAIQYYTWINLFMIGPWLLLLNILSSELRTQLVTSLTVPSMDQPPKTWNDLVVTNYSIEVFGLDATSAGVMFRSLLSANNTLAMSIKKNIVKNYTLFEARACLRSTQDSTTNVCLGSVNIGKVFATEHFTTKSGESLVNICSDPLVALHAVLYYSKRMPYLQERFNRILSSFLETGLFKRLSNYAEYLKKGKENAKKREISSNQYSSEILEIKPHRLNFALIVAFGCGCSFFVVLIEIFIKRPAITRLQSVKATYLTNH